MPFVLRRQFTYLIEHVLNKYAVSSRRVIDENVGDSSNELAILNDWAAAHECVQVGTTIL